MQDILLLFFFSLYLPKANEETSLSISAARGKLELFSHVPFLLYLVTKESLLTYLENFAEQM